MKPTIIRSTDLHEHDYGATKVTDILQSEDYPFSIAKVQKVGEDVKVGFDTESDVAYYVLEGEGDCIIDGETHHLQKGDCVVYPKGTLYKHMKGLTLLAIALPRFDRTKRKYIE